MAKYVHYVVADPQDMFLMHSDKDKAIWTREGDNALQFTSREFASERAEEVSNAWYSNSKARVVRVSVEYTEIV